MELESPDEHVRERRRKPHWKRSNFWKMFGTLLVVYLIFRILLNVVLDWASPPVESQTGSETSSPIAAPTDQPAPAKPSK